MSHDYNFCQIFPEKGQEDKIIESAVTKISEEQRIKRLSKDDFMYERNREGWSLSYGIGKKS